MSKMIRQAQTWELSQNAENTRSRMPSLRSTRVTLKREWERSGEIAWVVVAVGRASVVELPPADLDELIDLLQQIRDELTDDECAGPEFIRKHNDRLRKEKLAQARQQEMESEQCA